MDYDPKARPSSPQILLEEAKLDHRRRRRNRMRASCLNCYASKRKCDKKRPCGRCVRLGTTGLCVYEVEDTVDGLMDETESNANKRLKYRIAELESVIRELKKNPHPRWTAPGGVVHDPNFFGSYRKPNPQSMAGNTRSRTGDTVDDVASVEGQVKTEETTLCASESAATAKGVLHGSSQALPPYLSRPPVSLSVDSNMTVAGPSITPTTTDSSPSHNFHNEPSNNIPKMYWLSNSTPMICQATTSVNTVTACSLSTTDTSGENLSPPHRPHFSNCVPTSNAGFQTATSASVSLKNITPSSDKGPDPCNCLKAPMAFGPLVHLGIALRTSREALERLHPLSSDCALFRRINVLEQHIFSVSPHEKSIKLKPFSSPCMGSESSRSHTTSPHPPSKDGHGYLFPHPLSHSTPTYSLSHQYHQPVPRSPDPFAYMSNTTVFTQLHQWD